MKQRYFCILVGMMVFFVVQAGAVSAHTVSPSSKQVHTTAKTTPAFTCGADNCDSIAPAGASCGTSTRIYDAPMIAHNGTTVGHLYWYYYTSCNFPSWGTFHLSSGIKSGTVYETRSHTTDDLIVNESATYTNPSTGVYHDTAMLGCDFDSPDPKDYFNAAIDWQDAQGFFLHTQTTTDMILNC